MAKRLTAKAIRYAIGQLKKGKSPSVVASEIGVTPRHVRRLWTEFRVTGSPHVPKTPGRPAAKLSPDEVQLVLGEHKREDVDVVRVAGYDAVTNYKVIRDSGRRPVICTCKNHVARGFGPRAEMIRWQENPEEFEETYHQRSIVESVFSSFKCRFTAVVRAKTLQTQRLQLLLRCVCYNMLS